ncbi:hypothetical protein ACP70R_015290 [Stipagrostis hirtigluma subsp. patula]
MHSRCSVTGNNLADVEYRSSDRETDILRHVFRWDRAPYDFVFANGFEARRQEGTSDAMYFNLERYVNNGGRPLDTRRDTTHAFVSTTISSHWTPTVNPGVEDILFRYEIYAPGGIHVAETLGDLYKYKAQDEVSFPAGIAPQYVRSAQIFKLTNNRGHTRRERVNTVLYVNRYFSPQSAPEPRKLKIQRPVSDFKGGNGRRQKLDIEIVPEVQKRSAAANNDDMIEYYTEGVLDADYYIDSAFRSTETNEAYIFIQEEYVLEDYAPGSTGDEIVNGPHYIGNSFYSLVGTPFAEYGIDAAFSYNGSTTEAFIFCGNICAKINYKPGSTTDWIIEGPKTIKQMFPFLKGTQFERGIDAAFQSTKNGEAYLFKGSDYALIDYSKDSERYLVAIRPISDGFRCLSNTMFARDIGASFASHKSQEAYLFKDNMYLRLYFTPGKTDDYIIDGPKPVVPRNWPSLRYILPHKNRGLDVYEFPVSDPKRDQDDQED